MAITSKHDEQTNLHELPSLRRVQVRDDVVLRPIQEADAPEILEILEADPAIRERVTVAARMHTPEDVAREIAFSRADGSFIRYAIEEAGRCVGLLSFWRDTGFFGQEPRSNAYGFGYFLAPSVRGRGLATDCVRAMMDTAGRNVRVDWFMSFCEDDNPRSSAVLERLGFVGTQTTYREPTHGWTERLYEKRVAHEQ